MPDIEVALEEQTAAKPTTRARAALQRIAIRPGGLVACVFFACMLLYFNYLPLWHTDLWGFVNYGKWILEHGRLPAADPFMPLAEGIRVINSSWLAQVIFGTVEGLGGADWLSNLYAITEVLVFALLARVFFVQTQRLWLSLCGSALVFFLAQSRILVIRPEMFGCVCCALLFWLLAREYEFLLASNGDGTAGARASGKRRGLTDRLLLWLGVPVIFVLWANLHGSFAVGLAILGCCTMGQAIESLWKRRNLKSLIEAPEFRRWVLLTELAIGATLVNPYGVDLMIYTAQFASNPNLRDVWEWKPYNFLGPGGMHLAVSFVLIMLAMRWSRRRMRPVEVLLLGLFGIATLASIRLITWYSIVVGFVLVPHLADIADQCRAATGAGFWGASAARGVSEFWSRRSWKYGFVSAWVVWVTFAVSGLSRPVLGGNPRPPEHLYNSLTPRGISKFLRENPPQGQIWNPQVLGDWLAWDGPPGMKMFTTTNIHLIPNHVWRDYMYVFDGLPGWERTLDKYHVDTVVTDKELQKTLPRVMRRTPGWRVAYEDEQGTVFVRTRRAAPVDKTETRAATSDMPAGIGDDANPSHTQRVKQ
jgi:hypothetical protein